MKPKTVLILEDDPALRGTLDDGLRKRGFTSIAAGSADEAWRKLADVPDLDVAVLDIRLGEGPIPTGLDFGLELKKQRNEWPPEFLILSAYETPNYYQAALTLGAAAYLTKGTLEKSIANGVSPPKRADIVARHVRALALRRALQSERPGMTRRLRVIAEESATRDEAVERFCREVLSQELETTLGRDYILLLTAAGKTVGFPGQPLPSTSACVFAQLQSVVHARLGEIEPFIVDTDDALYASSEEREATQRVLRPFDGAAFVPLGDAKSFRLSLGVVPGEHGTDAVREQVRLLDQYLQKRVISHLIELTELWLELRRANEAQKREALLTATSKFCLYQGHEIQSALWEAERNSDNTAEMGPFNQLRAIGTEMRDAGELLTHFTETSEGHLPSASSIDMAQLVGRVWNDEVTPSLRLAKQGVLRVVGTCFAFDRTERAERAVSQLLGWLARRLIRSRQNDDLELMVACIDKGRDRVQVVFEEKVSRRLPAELRNWLFEPFYASYESDRHDERVVDGGRRLGLYLAQALAEMAGGTLSDRSDDMEGPLGHRFVLELPAPSDVS